VILDDVITTGATAAACTAALRSIGVQVAAVLALTATT
jgi:predicted amidophosphoribosyltransferase